MSRWSALTGCCRGIVGQVLETGLEIELTEELGYERHERSESLAEWFVARDGFEVKAEVFDGPEIERNVGFVVFDDNGGPPGAGDEAKVVQSGGVPGGVSPLANVSPWMGLTS